MGYGRLIRIRTHRRDADATIYVVAEAEVDKAIAILQRAVSQPKLRVRGFGPRERYLAGGLIAGERSVRSDVSTANRHKVPFGTFRLRVG